VLLQKGAWGKFEGDYSVECELSNPWFNDLVLGNASTSGAGPYTHTYDDSKTVNAITTELGVDTSTDRVLRLQRSTVRELKITANLDETVKLNYDMQFGDTPTSAETTLDASVVTDDQSTAYTFAAGAILEYPSGTPLAEVQGFDMTMNPNIKMVYEPNSAKAVNAFKGKLDLTGNFSISVQNNTWWNNVRARAELASTMRMKFTNGLSGTNERTIQYTFTGVLLGENTMSVPQDDLITESLPLRFRDVQAVCTNNTAVPP
jgi:hypothetical protein